VKQHHKKILVAGLILLALGWLAWMGLLTGSEEPPAPQTQQSN